MQYAIIFLKFKSSKNRGCVHRNEAKLIDQEKKLRVLSDSLGLNAPEPQESKLLVCKSL